MCAQLRKTDFNCDLAVATATLCRPAVAINPNDTELVGEYGMRLALYGDWSSGCPLIEQAFAKKPAPQPDYEVMLGLCSYMAGDYQKALFLARQACDFALRRIGRYEQANSVNCRRPIDSDRRARSANRIEMSQSLAARSGLIGLASICLDTALGANLCRHDCRWLTNWS
jgi:hypothetical protein